MVELDCMVFAYELVLSVVAAALLDVELSVVPVSLTFCLLDDSGVSLF